MPFELISPSALALSTKLYVASGAGVLSHHLIFRKGEWHLAAPYLFILFLVFIPGLAFAEGIFATRYNVLTSLNSATLVLSSFTLSLFASIAVYRLYFHPLRNFPGPRIAAVTKLWHAWHCVQGKNHVFVQGIRERYGDVVRTGPNEVTCFTPDVLYKLNGPGNKNVKSAFYDIIHPQLGVATIRDLKLHDERRKLWVASLGGKDLSLYQKRIMQHTICLEEVIAESAATKTPVDFKDLGYWHSFDIMGLFVFDQNFNMIAHEKWRYAMYMLRQAFLVVGPVTPVPWLAHIGFMVFKRRWVVKPWHDMIDWCRDRIMERVANDSDQRDLATRLVRDFKAMAHDKTAQDLLLGEAIVAIVAGSDTVGGTTSFLFYELAKHPEHCEKIRQELQGIDVHDVKALLELPHLKACINETLRFHHIIPTGGYRNAAPGGIEIGGKFIPEGTTVSAPRYILSRLESCFERADEWIPERWTTRPEMVKDSRPFMPFAMGRYACPGKTIAMSELSAMVALLVSKYEISFPPGDDGSAVESEMIDQFTAVPGKLDLVFTPRL